MTTQRPQTMHVMNTRSSAWQGVWMLVEMLVSGAGGHVGGEDVVGVAVEVLACPVVAHGGAGVGVAGGDLDITQINSGIQTQLRSLNEPPRV